MRIAGLGFRSTAPLAALREAIARAGGGTLAALATAEDKAQIPVLLALAEEMGIPILAQPPAALAGREVETRSPRVKARYGTGSIAEAAALAAAGPDARLTGPRAISSDRTATAAIAERTDP